MRQRFNPHKIKKKFGHKGQSNAQFLHALSQIKIVGKEKKENLEQQEKAVAINTGGFSKFALNEKILANILHKKYTSPTPIQEQVIPEILKGLDVIGIANTGTGKTAAFLIPLVQKVLHNRQEKVLIVAPTRELALQIQQELQGFSYGLGMHTVLCIGGMSMWVQKNGLKTNPQFVIGTPGRIKDLILEKVLFLHQFHTVVLDETDRMVDIGFIQDIKYFISLLPHNRQSLFFSATVSGKVKEILTSFVQNPVTISVKQQETAENIHQDVVHVKRGEKKIDVLHNLLIQDGFEKVLIFGRTKWGIEKLSKELLRRGFKVGAIHGNKRQNQRQRMLEEFKQGKITILLATDVASRGLDIQDVTHVINYDMPATMDDYIHRIGRTGRADKKGTALTFIDE